MALRQELDGETIIPSRDEGRYLRLDADGFTAFTKRSQKGRAWSEVSGFKPANVKPGTPDHLGGGKPWYQIGFFLSDPPKKGRISRWVVRRTYGVDDTATDGVLPPLTQVGGG